MHKQSLFQAKCEQVLVLADHAQQSTQKCPSYLGLYTKDSLEERCFEEVQFLRYGQWDTLDDLLKNEKQTLERLMESAPC